MGCTLGKGSKPDKFDKPEIPREETFQTNLVRNTDASQYELVYEEGKLLGEGITGCVYEVTHRVTKRKFASKTINLGSVDKAQLKELYTEIKLLRQLDHPNIVKLYEVYEDKETQVLKVVMELLTGGHLGMRVLENEDAIRSAIKQIVCACRYFHERGICHRDLKLENILWSSEGPDAIVKIIDFGLGAQFYTEERLVQRQRMLMRRGSIVGPYDSDDQVPIPGMDAEDPELDLVDQLRINGPNGSGKSSGSGDGGGGGGGGGGVQRRSTSPVLGESSNHSAESGGSGGDSRPGSPSKLGRGHTAPSPAKRRQAERELKQSRIFQTACGTAFYLPPEAVVATGKGYNGEKMDMWAVGVTAYALIAKRPPFVGKSEMQVFERIRRCQPDYSLPAFRKVSSAASRFVQCCLVADPERRYSAEEALGSAWLKTASMGMGGYVPDDAFRERVVASMRKFATYQSLKKSALMIVAHHQTDFQCIKLNSCFHEIDSNCQGHITYRELGAFLRKVAPDMDKREVRRVYKAIDQDRTSAVTYMEFLAASLEAESPILEEQAEIAFSHLDQGCTGAITHASLTKLLGHGFTEEEIAGIMKEVNKTDGGTVSREQFYSAMVDNVRPSKGEGDVHDFDSDAGFSSEGDESMIGSDGESYSHGRYASGDDMSGLLDGVESAAGSPRTPPPKSPRQLVEGIALGSSRSVCLEGVPEEPLLEGAEPEAKPAPLLAPAPIPKPAPAPAPEPEAEASANGKGVAAAPSTNSAASPTESSSGGDASDEQDADGDDETDGDDGASVAGAADTSTSKSSAVPAATAAART